MNDDLHKLVTEEFPVLAHKIAHTGLSLLPLFRGYRGKPEGIPFAHRKGFGRFHSQFTDYDKPFLYDRAVVMPDDLGGGTGYRYAPVNKEGKKVNPGRIIFHNLRLKDISDIEVGELDVADVESKSKVITLDEYQNDGPRDFRRRTEVEKEIETSKEKSFGWMVSAELRIRMTQRVGVSMEVFEAGGELETELTTRAEKRGDEEWRQSDRRRETTENEYYVSPYHDWTLTTEQSVKNISQDVFITGVLECQILIEYPGWGYHNFRSLEDLRNAFTGFLPQAGFVGNWFADPDNSISLQTVNDWEQPELTLNCPIKGQRTRYSKAVSKQRPIPGREKLLEQSDEDDDGFAFPSLDGGDSDYEDELDDELSEEELDSLDSLNEDDYEEIDDDELDDHEKLRERQRRRRKKRNKGKNKGKGKNKDKNKKQNKGVNDGTQ